MKYTKEITDRLIADYKAGVTPDQIAKNFEVPTRSVIAKLSSLGIYQRKPYLNKLGEQPEKKSEVIIRLGNLLDMPLELLESLEKVNKVVLKRIEQKLLQP
jgi:DNA polymerase I-like protein with 3'-5' exonuclease and polymerase domains